MPVAPPPEGGDGGEGAARIVTQEQSEQTAGGDRLERTVEVGARSIPSDVYFQFRLPAHGYTRGAGLAYAQGFGLLIEGLLVEPTIDAVAYLQDVDRAGNLLDKLDVFWTTPDGTAQGDVEVLMGSATIDSVLAAVRQDMAPYAG